MRQFSWPCSPIWSRLGIMFYVLFVDGGGDGSSNRGIKVLWGVHKQTIGAHCFKLEKTFGKFPVSNFVTLAGLTDLGEFQKNVFARLRVGSASCASFYVHRLFLNIHHLSECFFISSIDSWSVNGHPSYEQLNAFMPSASLFLCAILVQRIPSFILK